MNKKRKRSFLFGWYGFVGGIGVVVPGSFCCVDGGGGGGGSKQEKYIITVGGQKKKQGNCSYFLFIYIYKYIYIRIPKLETVRRPRPADGGGDGGGVKNESNFEKNIYLRETFIFLFFIIGYSNAPFFSSRVPLFLLPAYTVFFEWRVTSFYFHSNSSR